MAKKTLNLLIVFGMLTVFGPLALAHILDIEPQILEEIPVPVLPKDKSDFSFETPYLIDKVVKIGDKKVKIGVVDSQAIFSYLTPGDVDFFKFKITPNDLKTGPVLVSASALPPACVENQNNYPITALIGTRLPRPPVDLKLPFQVPAGKGVIIANNPVIKKGGRPIFDIDIAEPGLELGIAWFLPLGLTMECLLNPPPLCDFSNTIFQFISVPGTYWIAIFDPSGKVQDYTANIGFSEINFVPNPEIEDLVRDNGHLHTPCHEPVNESYDLAVSTKSDRSNPLPLAEQILSDDVYIFLTPSFPESEIKKVKFCLEGCRVKTERYAPYDLRGTRDSGEAAPLRTHRLSNGRYTIRADITFYSGGKLSVSAAFYVFNESNSL